MRGEGRVRVVGGGTSRRRPAKFVILSDRYDFKTSRKKLMIDNDSCRVRLSMADKDHGSTSPDCHCYRHQ